MAKSTSKTKSRKKRKKRKNTNKTAEQLEVAVNQQKRGSQDVDEQTAQTDEESIHAKYERIKKGELYLKDLQNLTVAELHEVARKEKVKEYQALKKQDLIFKIDGLNS